MISESCRLPYLHVIKSFFGKPAPTLPHDAPARAVRNAGTGFRAERGIMRVCRRPDLYLRREISD